MRKIKDMYEQDRPREKMKKKGPDALSDFELLEVIIGSGSKGMDVGQIAKNVLKKFKTGIEKLTLDQLETIKGMNLAKASKIIASIEISKRYILKESVRVKNAKDILPLVQEYRNKKQEYFICITLDGASNVMQKRIISVGTAEQSIVHPREVFADAINDRAAGVIFAHNHPTGDLNPSDEDKSITTRLVEAGKLLGIIVIDHIIVTSKSYFSFKEKGMV
jgi:DNA repair protein RadC